MSELNGGLKFMRGRGGWRVFGGEVSAGGSSERWRGWDARGSVSQGEGDGMVDRERIFEVESDF